MDNTELFETTTDRTLTYAPTWAFAVKYQEKTIEFAWSVVTHSEHEDFITYCPRVRIDGEKANVEDYQWIVSVARKIRATELTEEFEEKAPTVGSMESPKSTVKDRIIELYNRALTGEFVGQRQGTIIYVQEIAEVLDLPMGYLLTLINQELIPEKRIGLNGMILTSWESQENARAYLEDHFGHKNMSRSDFGWWGCSHCKQGGDDMDDPRDYACVTPQESKDTRVKNQTNKNPHDDFNENNYTGDLGWSKEILASASAIYGRAMIVDKNAPTFTNLDIDTLDHYCIMASNAHEAVKKLKNK